jgi:hypothetical protein
MMPEEEEPAREEEEPARWFVLTGGRSAPRYTVDPLDMVAAVQVPHKNVRGEAADILRLCQQPRAIVEISSLLHLPVTLIAIFLGDLVDQQMATIHPVQQVGAMKHAPETQLLERVLHGLRRQRNRDLA